MAKSSSDFVFADEKFYLSEVLDGNEGGDLKELLDAKFAEQLQFQDAIFHSLTETTPSLRPVRYSRTTSSVRMFQPRTLKPLPGMYAPKAYLSEVLDGNEGGDLKELDAKFAEQLQFQDAIFHSVPETMPSSGPVSRATSSVRVFQPRTLKPLPGNFVPKANLSEVLDGNKGGALKELDAKFAEQLQFQDAIFHPDPMPSSRPVSRASSSVQFQDAIFHSVLDPMPSSRPVWYSRATSSVREFQPMTLKPLPGMYVPKSGESSLSYCGICFERKERRQMFPISSCSHSFCSDCISSLVERRLKEHISIIMCPGDNCRVMLQLEACRALLPKDIIGLWEDLLCEERLCATGGRLKPLPGKYVRKAGESSLSYCECGICFERKERRQMFPISGCSHSFCSDCISSLVETRLKEHITIIMCPGDNCRVMLQLEACRPLLPKDIIGIWEDLLCEELLCATGGRLYCPFKDCSALLLNDIRGEVIKESECPFCHRLFCAQCHVPWHNEIDCEDFQKLNEDERGREDIMMRKLAKEKKWTRCPSCHITIERTEGCPHMTCRCKFQFCYRCGAEWTQNHHGCQGN